MITLAGTNPSQSELLHSVFAVFAYDMQVAKFFMYSFMVPSDDLLMRRSHTHTHTHTHTHKTYRDSFHFC